MRERASERHADCQRKIRIATHSGRTTSSLLRELVAYLRQQRTELRAEWVNRITDARAPARDDRRKRSSPRSRRSTTTTSTRSRPAASRRCRTTLASSPSGSSRAASRRTRCSASCSCCATCWPARCSSATRTTRTASPSPRRLRAGREPDRGHRRRQLRRGARARHPRATGFDPRALDARCCRCANGC